MFMSDFTCVWKSCFHCSSQFVTQLLTIPPIFLQPSCTSCLSQEPHFPDCVLMVPSPWPPTVSSLLVSFPLIAWQYCHTGFPDSWASVRQVCILDPVLPLPLLEVVPHQSLKFSQEKLGGDLKGSPSVPPILYNFRGFFKTKLHL